MCEYFLRFSFDKDEYEILELGMRNFVLKYHTINLPTHYGWNRIICRI
jgi:hypothetical protein